MMSWLIALLLHAFVLEQVQSGRQDTTFEEWKLKFDKKYPTIEEEMIRRKKWEQNFQNIKAHNIRFELGQETYAVGLNRFSDLDQQEFKQFYLSPGIKLGKQTMDNGIQPDISKRPQLPTELDWRKAGLVTPIKQQGNCGSCWAFSAIGAVEVQQLVDCSSGFGNSGCSGGLMEQAFDYLRQYGVMTENVYQYTGKDEGCKFDADAVVAYLEGYFKEHTGNETRLQSLVSEFGPVSIAIDATYIHSYTHGVFRSDFCSVYYLNHGMLLVGYGVENGQDFWLLKNSWGTDWGDQGYMKLARNEDNMCGIASLASVPSIT